MENALSMHAGKMIRQGVLCSGWLMIGQGRWKIEKLPDKPAASDCQKSLFDSLVDEGASSPATTTPSTLFSRARRAQLKSARKRFFLQKIEFSSGKIAAVAPCTPPRPISFCIPAKFLDKLKLPDKPAA